MRPINGNPENPDQLIITTRSGVNERAVPHASTLLVSAIHKPESVWAADACVP